MGVGKIIIIKKTYAREDVRKKKSRAKKTLREKNPCRMNCTDEVKGTYSSFLGPAGIPISLSILADKSHDRVYTVCSCTVI